MARASCSALKLRKDFRPNCNGPARTEASLHRSAHSSLFSALRLRLGPMPNRFAPFPRKSHRHVVASSGAEHRSESRAGAAIYILAFHDAGTLPCPSIPRPSTTSNPRAWSLPVSDLETRARCSTRGPPGPTTKAGCQSASAAPGCRWFRRRRRRGATASPVTPLFPRSSPAEVSKNFERCISWFLACEFRSSS